MKLQSHSTLVLGTCVEAEALNAEQSRWTFGLSPTRPYMLHPAEACHRAGGLQTHPYPPITAQGSMGYSLLHVKVREELASQAL